MSAIKRPKLKGADRQFFWGEHELIDHGVPAKIGISAWAVYTALLRHFNDEDGAYPSVQLMKAELGISNRVIANSLRKLASVGLILIDRRTHKGNKYQVLDCLEAIRKNDWTRVSTKARDDLSPTMQSDELKAEQVMKSHLTRDDSSLGQVTNRHTKKNQLKRTIEKETTSAAGAADGTGNLEHPNPLPTEIQTAGGGGARTTYMGSATVSPAAALEEACRIIEGAFQNLRAKNKVAAVKKLASEALHLGFSVQEIQSAVSWASQDTWWATKLVPNNFDEMMTRWDREHSLHSAPQPRGGVATGSPIIEFTFTPGERRKAPDGKVLTVDYAEDGQVFWMEAVAEAPARLVYGWPLVEAVGA